MSDSPAGEVTALLRAWRAGDEDAYRRVASILYDELRRQAAQYMHRQQFGDTLQTTALVHEAFIRLAGAQRVDWQDRKHFLAVAARTMRRVLVDVVRAQGASKRGSRAIHVPLDSSLEAGGPSPLDLIALDRALEGLAKLDARKVQVVELRFSCRPDGRRDRPSAGCCPRHRRPRLAHVADVAAQRAPRRVETVTVASFAPAKLSAGGGTISHPRTGRAV